MKDIEIKKEIYRHYNLHKNTKIKLDHKHLTFKMKLGDCTSIDIPFPLKCQRDLKIEKILS